MGFSDHVKPFGKGFEGFKKGFSGKVELLFVLTEILFKKFPNWGFSHDFGVFIVYDDFVLSKSKIYTSVKI